MKALCILFFTALSWLLLVFFSGALATNTSTVNSVKANQDDNSKKDTPVSTDNQKGEDLKSTPQCGMDDNGEKETSNKSTGNENVNISSGGNNNNNNRRIPEHIRIALPKEKNYFDEIQKKKKKEDQPVTPVVSVPDKKNNVKVQEKAKMDKKENAKDDMQNTAEKEDPFEKGEREVITSPIYITPESIAKVSDILGIDKDLLNEIVQTDMFQDLMKSGNLKKLTDSVDVSADDESADEKKAAPVNSKIFNLFTDDFMKYVENILSQKLHDKNKNGSSKITGNMPSVVNNEKEKNAPKKDVKGKEGKVTNKNGENAKGDSDGDSTAASDGANNGNDKNNDDDDDDEYVNDDDDEEESQYDEQDVEEEEVEEDDDEEEGRKNVADKKKESILKKDFANTAAAHSSNVDPVLKNIGNDRNENISEDATGFSKEKTLPDSKKNHEPIISAEKLKSLNEIKQLENTLKKMGVDIDKLKKKYESKNFYVGDILNKEKPFFSDSVINDYIKSLDTSDNKSGNIKNDALKEYKERVSKPPIPDHNILYEGLFLEEDINRDGSQEALNTNDGFTGSGTSSSKLTDGMNRSKTTQSEESSVNSSVEDVFEEKAKENYVGANEKISENYKMGNMQMNEQTKNILKFDDYYNSRPMSHMPQVGVMDDKRYMETYETENHKDVDKNNVGYKQDPKTMSGEISKNNELRSFVSKNVSEQHENKGNRHAANAKGVTFNSNSMYDDGSNDDNRLIGNDTKMKDTLKIEKNFESAVSKENKSAKEGATVDLYKELAKINKKGTDEGDSELKHVASVLEKLLKLINIDDNKNGEDGSRKGEDELDDDSKKFDVSQFKDSLKELSGNSLDSKQLDTIVNNFLKVNAQKKAKKETAKQKTNVTHDDNIDSKKKKKQTIDYSKLTNEQLKKLMLPSKQFYDVSPYSDKEKAYNVNEAAGVPNEQLEKYIKKSRYFNISYDPKNIDYMKQKKKENKDQEEDDDYDIYQQIKNSYEGIPANYANYAPQLINKKTYVYTSSADPKRGLIEYLKERYRKKKKWNWKRKGIKESVFLRNSVYNDVVMEDAEETPENKNYAFDYSFNDEKAAEHADRVSVDIYKHDKDDEDSEDSEDGDSISLKDFKKYKDQLLELISSKKDSDAGDLTVDIVERLFKCLDPSSVVSLNEKPEQVSDIMMEDETTNDSDDEDDAEDF